MDQPNYPNWLDSFVTPSVEFRPIPFWSWNEVMEEGEIRRQIDLMADAGWGGAFIHARIGLITSYLRQDWFRAVDAAIDQSRRRGLKVWLYDEDKWPSGFSGGSVPLADEAFRMKSLFARPIGASPATGSIPIGPARNGVQVYAWTSPLGYDWFNGTCYTDLLDRHAVRKFIDDAYEPYFRRYRKEYGSLIAAAFTDEPCPLFIRRLPAGSVPYTPAVIEDFKREWNYDPIPHLFQLFADNEHSAQFRLHYYRTLNGLFERNFTRQIAEWCSQRGIALTGHFLVEGSLYDQQAWGARLMPNYRHFGIPGIDHLGRQIDERITAKQCHSVANQFGKKRMMSELYGVTGGSLSFEDRWWIASQQVCLGVNLLVPHLALYTMAGCRKRDFPQNIFHQQPWWPMNQHIDLPLSRLCVAMSQGTYHAETLVIHPQESTFALWRAKMPPEQPDELVAYDSHPTCPDAIEQIDQLDRDVKAVMDVLLTAQRTLDFGDEAILAESSSVQMHDGRTWLRVGQMDYPAVLLPSMYTMARTTFEVLHRFHSAGGRIIRCGTSASLLEGKPDTKLDAWLADLPAVDVETLPQALAQIVPPAVRLMDTAPQQVYTHVRNLSHDERLVMLTNLDRREFVTSTAHLSGQYKGLHELDLRTGKSIPFAATRQSDALAIDLTLAPTQTRVFRLGDFVNPAATTSSRSVATMDLHPSEWTLERLDDNTMTLDCAFYRQGNHRWSDRAVPVIALQKLLNGAQYDGPVSLCYSVEVAQFDRTRRMRLVVEHPDRYCISINGQQVQYTGLPPWRDVRWLPIDITGLLMPGTNTIELHCERFQFGDLAHIKDQFRRYGTELESIYLVGDFSVETDLLAEQPVSPLWKQWGLPTIDVRCFDPRMRLSDPQPLTFGDVTAQGLPFYAGRLRMSARLPAIPDAAIATFHIEHLDAPAGEVAVDDAICGQLMTHPLNVALSPGREISMTLYGTLRNLLGPHHSIDGELPAVGPDSFLPRCPENIDSTAWLQQWLAGKLTPIDWSDRYCMVTFGELKRTWISFEN